MFSRVKRTQITITDYRINPMQQTITNTQQKNHKANSSKTITSEMIIELLSLMMICLRGTYAHAGAPWKNSFHRHENHLHEKKKNVNYTYIKKTKKKIHS